jgi:hypothetical protein
MGEADEATLIDTISDEAHGEHVTFAMEGVAVAAPWIVASSRTSRSESPVEVARARSFYGLRPSLKRVGFARSDSPQTHVRNPPHDDAAILYTLRVWARVAMQPVSCSNPTS